MSVPFEIIGWALQWHAQTYGGGPVENMTPPRYSPDFTNVREIVYDEWVHYGFHLLVKRTNPYFHLFAEGALLPLKGDKLTYMDIDSPGEFVKPRLSYYPMKPAPGYNEKTDEHHIMLYWPIKNSENHEYGTTRQFQFRIGWKSKDASNTILPQFTELPKVSVFISDVIPK